jgi:Ca2+-binding EF-hand superfamily protein
MRALLLMMQIALMVHDAVEKSDIMTAYDSFLVFDLDGSGSISYLEFKEASARSCVHQFIK